MRRDMVIGITYHESSKRFLPGLLDSLKEVKYSIYVICNNMDSKETVQLARKFLDHPRGKHNLFFVSNPVGGFDPGAMRMLLDTSRADEIFMLQATVVIKDLAIFDIAAAHKGSLAVSKGFFHFFGKYRRKIIEQVGLPIPQTKKAAIFWEHYWSLVYADAEPYMASCENPLEDTDVFEKKFGRLNMVLENHFVKKWKGNWGQGKDSGYVCITEDQARMSQLAFKKKVI